MKHHGCVYTNVFTSKYVYGLVQCTAWANDDFHIHHYSPVHGRCASRAWTRSCSWRSDCAWRGCAGWWGVAAQRVGPTSRTTHRPSTGLQFVWNFYLLLILYFYSKATGRYLFAFKNGKCWDRCSGSGMFIPDLFFPSRVDPGFNNNKKGEGKNSSIVFSNFGTINLTKLTFSKVIGCIRDLGSWSRNQKALDPGPWLR
jgi:hypothetical protein